MSRVLAGLACLLFVAIAGPARGWAQDAPVIPPLRVFLECAACNPDAARTEISYVDWAADRADADLVVVAREQAANGGARMYVLDFTGLRAHEGRADTLTYTPAQAETPDATAQGLRRIMTLGMMRYLANTPLASRVQIQLPRPAAGTAERVAARDPWNFWTFSVGGSGSTSGESSRNSLSTSVNFSGNRTTADWKVSFSGSGSRNRQSITYQIAGRDTTSVTTTESSGFSALLVRSLTGHLSAGIRSNAGTSTVNNTKVYMNVSPAIEYNIFPYSESTRRSLTLEYSAGLISQRYREETIYFQMEETRPLHSFTGGYSTRASWGSVGVSLDGSQYLHNTKLYSLGTSGSASINLIRGLSLSLSGSYSRIRNQITLPRRQATPEEVLLRQRTLATNFRYSTSMSLSYRFGSGVQNVVNPRFGGGGGGGGVIFFD